MRKSILFSFAAGLTMFFVSCSKRDVSPAADQPVPSGQVVNVSRYWTTDDAGEAIRMASPKLYEQVSQSQSSRAPIVTSIHGWLVGIGPPPENEPNCAKNACSKCVCCYVVDGGALIPNVNDPGNLGDIPADLLTPEEFNILGSSPGVKFLILADDAPNVDTISSITATDEGNIITLQITK
ncbi:MAG: hypothetical protein ACRCYO_18815 [Bacteroidia bacterium]